MLSDDETQITQHSTQYFMINMICIRADIPNELSLIDDELKAIYHSTDTVCFYIFQTREKRNEFMERTQGMKKTEREEIYKSLRSPM